MDIQSRSVHSGAVSPAAFALLAFALSASALALVAALVTACSSTQPRAKQVATPVAQVLPDYPGGPVNRDLVAEGYRPSTFHGQLMYCRVEKLTGSQFSHKVCLTEQEARLQERMIHDQLNTVHGQGKCIPPQCND